MTDRWQPSRAGIINVWRYYDEIFSFYQGRLLLRGPNGTGKSKALELLLPYLFDANLRPHRLSTFGSADRTMHWNLMGEGNQGSTRVGYLWLEFQHGEEPPVDASVVRLIELLTESTSLPVLELEHAPLGPLSNWGPRRANGVSINFCRPG